MKNILEGDCIDNTEEAFDKLIDMGYSIEDRHFTRIDYYKKYPFLVIYNGHIIFCHDRHLNRDDLYGENKMIKYVDGDFHLNLTRKETT